MIAGVAVGTEDLVVADGGAVVDIAEGGHDTAEGIGQVKDRVGTAIHGTEQSPCQRVVVQVTAVGSVRGVGVFFEAKGVDGHGGA